MRSEFEKKNQAMSKVNSCSIRRSRPIVALTQVEEVEGEGLDEVAGVEEHTNSRTVVNQIPRKTTPTSQKERVKIDLSFSVSDVTTTVTLPLNVLKARRKINNLKLMWPR